MASDDERIQSETHAYRVLRTLGQGGQTRARLVERVDEPGTHFVLKLLRIEHVDDWKQVELFERQVTTLAALDHPGIPRLVDRIVEDGRTAGIVETFVDGHTIAQQITDHGPVSPAKFEQILREGLEILAYLHRRVPPVLHRDINPKNVMLGRDRVYIIDFGSVRVGGKTDMTSVGTFGYMPPEQIMGRAQAASDIYGLGMTMVSLAERRDVSDLPIDEATGQVDPKRLLSSVEPRVRDVVLAMIQPGLADRLGDPREALRRLDAKDLPARLPEARTPAQPQPQHRVRFAAIGLAVVMAASMGTYVVLQRTTAPPPPEPAPVAAPAPVPAPPPAPAPTAREPPRTAPATPPPTLRPEVVPTTLTDDNSATLTLTSAPTGVTARIDVDTECTTPCTIRLPFGKHTIHFEHDGERVDRDLRILEDTKLHVALDE